MLAVHVALLAWSAYRHSPVNTEVGHLPAGISHWRFGRFDLYRVNPPLVRMVAALPVLYARPATYWNHYSTDPLVRSETQVGIDFVNANGARTFWLYTLGRWACIPFSLIGAWVCYRWASALYGSASGLAALALWCFCPNVLGNGALVMPDVPAAALGAAACYLFWRWLQSPTWFGGLAAGAVLGVAELTKTTLLVFFPLWPLVWIAYRWSQGWSREPRRWQRETTMLAASLVVGLYVINLGYGFEGSFERLRDYTFKSHLLTGAPADDRAFAPGNRFAETPLAALPVPLPRDYLQGIDAQKLDFERGMPSYLRGQWSDRGWWYYYLYGLGIKLPLGTLALVGLAALAAICLREGRASWRDDLALLAPCAAIIVLVSSQNGFSVHFRYVLPALPFLFIWASKPFAFAGGQRTVSSGQRWSEPLPFVQAARRPLLVGMSVVALAWSVASSLWYYPHSLSYFNELVGGPEHGHEHLLDSSIAWGQDLLYLKEWHDAHPEARPFYLAASTRINPRQLGMHVRLPPFALKEVSGSSVTVKNAQGNGQQPGWYAIDVNFLKGADLFTPDGMGDFQRASELDLGTLRAHSPVARAGYSFWIYELKTKNTSDAFVDM
ncbi:MAG: glycosyltransferase family 39 protein [Pirellulales bacterium]|nr:glycosyltransferase family 39 protein [Pirellulales bacterium]